MAEASDAPPDAAAASELRAKARRARKVARQVEYQRRRLENATPEQAAEIRRRQNEYARAWRQRNPEKAKEVTRKSAKKARVADPEGCRAKANALRNKNKERLNANRKAAIARDPARQKRIRDAYYAKNKEKIRARARETWPRRAEKAKEQGRRWREANPGRNCELAKAWARANPERAKVRLKAWKEANPDYESRRRKEDPQFRVTLVLRNRLYIAVKRAATRKTDRSFALIGCSPQQLVAHLEAQFTEGMSWANHGEWHIDHIRPCCTFDLTDEAQQRAAFHYTNLRPLWAADNLARPRANWQQDHLT